LQPKTITLCPGRRWRGRGTGLGLWQMRVVLSHGALAKQEQGPAWLLWSLGEACGKLSKPELPHSGHRWFSLRAASFP
jgi:hypothetical protein